MGVSTQAQEKQSLSAAERRNFAAFVAFGAVWARKL